jgi:hypothetical protein
MPGKVRGSSADSVSIDVDADLKKEQQDVADQTVASGRWPQRFVIVALCFVAFMLCNMDRVNMSIAVLPMQKEYGWNSQTMGIVQSSFFWCVQRVLPTLSCHGQPHTVSRR